MTLQLKTELKGPIFKTVVGRTIRKAGEDAVKELVERGEQLLHEKLRRGPAGLFKSTAEARRGQASTGNYLRNIEGTAENLSGLIHDNEVLYGPWLEGTGSRNSPRSSFKGYSSFRKTAQQLEKEASKILDRHIKRLKRRID